LALFSIALTFSGFVWPGFIVLFILVTLIYALFFIYIFLLFFIITFANALRDFIINARNRLENAQNMATSFAANQLNVSESELTNIVEGNFDDKIVFDNIARASNLQF
jgi:predicted membrane protein